MAPAPVTVRTFDVDEGQLRAVAASRTATPAADRADGAGGRSGLRALRLSLAQRDLFELQLRALLRASRHGRLRIMFPFVSGVEELREAQAALREAAARAGGARRAGRRRCRRSAS